MSINKISNFYNTGEKIKKWVKENRFEAILVASILLIGAFLRLYRIDEYMTFLGDEGRDVIVVRRLLVNFDPILIGPGTSIGNMYLGPLYYYLMAPALLLANFSPVGPAVMIAILGVGTIFFVWYIGREWFGKVAGFVAGILYATAPVVIIYSRSSWNPNVMPFFSLLSIYAIWRVWKFNELKWLLVVGIAMALVLQSHYLGLLLVPTLGLFWFLKLLKLKTGPFGRALFKKFVYYSFLSLILFLLLMSPLVIFDARHGWRNFAAIKTFFTERQTTISARPWTAVPKLGLISEEISTRLIAGTNKNLSKFSYVFFVFGIPALAFLLFKQNGRIKNRDTFPLILLFAWIGFALIGFGVYKQHIYDHYYGFFFAAPFLLAGAIFQIFSEAATREKIFRLPGYSVLFLILGVFLYANFQNSPVRYPPNRQLQRTVDISKKISEEAGGEKFNIAVIAERNYEGAYQYFLEMWNTGIVVIDPLRPNDTIANQLFVVCELPKEKCDPTHNPKAEVANFGWSAIAEEWQVAGNTVYKLVHTE